MLVDGKAEPGNSARVSFSSASPIRTVPLEGALTGGSFCFVLFVFIVLLLNVQLKTRSS